VALVTWEVGGFDDPATSVVSQIALRGEQRFAFTVVSRSCHPEVRSLAEWRRVPVPEKPFRLRWAAFFLAASAPVRRARPDLVHTWGPAPMIPGRVDLASVAMLQAGYHAAADGRPPGAGPGWRLERAFKLGLERWSYGSRSGLIDVESEEAKRAFERHVPGAEVIVIPRTIDGERFRPEPADRQRVRQELGAAEGEIVVLFVGRDWALKGLDLAIEAVALVRKRGLRNLRLWVAGGDDGLPGRLPSRHGEIADRVRFLGLRSDIERLYRGADLFLLPSLYEHFCRAAHEAAATELPVVATPVGGVAELIDAGAGIAIERRAEPIAAALEGLAADPALRDRIGRRGREFSARFTPEASTDRYLERYERLLAPER
jgi:UDP-glucose:(heptosyl)LPS alpha-1,3-glucosyltransferase